MCQCWCGYFRSSRRSNEVGTVYYSDTYGLEDCLEILQVIPYDLTGDVIYPVAQVQNPEAEELESTTAKEFIDFLITDDAKTISGNTTLIQM